ncbi:hypothetical protein BDF14DRAFT_33746 [Spinellus fusiger]|nr:hypothetical protein BDF14DRAFT_33746 [Spinellus fusiger]
MNAFDCYRKYLLGKKSAQKHQKREYIENQAFRSFLLRAADDPRAKEWKGMLEGLLIEPVQRISRYTLLLQEILQYTPNTHPDWIGLTKTYAKFQDIAMMVDDDLTKLANMLHNLHTSIKDSPCSLINQSRTLVTHLDATEIHRETLKPIRAVTLFLFADKLMIASRPSHQSKGMDILTAKEDKDTSTGSFIPKKLERIRSSQTLKFKGWADIEQIELFDGNQDRPGSFLLRASPAQEQQPAQDQMASEAAAYLHKCPRLFSVVPPKENTSLLDSYIETCKDFIATFQKTQALARRYATTDETFSRTWQTLDTFSNFYTPENYINARYKNNIAIAYVEQGLEFDLKSLASPNNTPWIIGFVQADVRGFRFTLCSKLDLLERNPRHVTNTTEDEKYTNDFHCIFWNNVIMCERQLRYASLFANVHDKTTEEELQKQPRSRSRSRSLSRSTSVATLTKLLIHRSRSTSPSRSQKSPISISSSTPLVRPATDTEQQASHTTTERPPVRRNRAKSMSLDTNLMQLSPRTQKTSKEMLHQVSLSELRPYHLAPRPEASSLPIMNEKDKSHNRRSMPESLWTSNLMKRYSDNDTLRTESPIRYELSDKISAANHSVDKTDTESTHSSSRNNTPSITSAHYSNHNSSPHSSLSNTFSSFTSHSTRSSLSLEDLEVPRNQWIQIPLI